MSYADTANRLHAEGCNCCQSVFGSCCEKYGLSFEQAYRLGAFLNGGLRVGSVCGAVLGALQGLGMEFGDENNRQCGASLAFLKAFEERFGSIDCAVLVGPNGEKKKELCPEIIRFAAQYLEDECK